MSILYAQIEALTAMMVNAIYAQTPEEAETNYTTLPVPADVYQDPKFAQSFVRDQIRFAEVEIIKAICQADKHPQRGQYYAFTGALAYGDELPDSVGPYGAVRGKVSLRPMSPAAKSRIDCWVDEEVTSPNYAFDGQRIYHALAEAVEVEAATISLAARSLFEETDADGYIRLDDDFANLLAAKALTFLPLRDAYKPELAAAMRQYVSDYMAVIAGSREAVPVFPALPSE